MEEETLNLIGIPDLIPRVFSGFKAEFRILGGRDSDQK